jgi:hypothetical protein
VPTPSAVVVSDVNLVSAIDPANMVLVTVPVSPIVTAVVVNAGNVIFVAPEVVKVKACAPALVSEAFATPRFVMELLLLSRPFLATNLLAVPIIPFPYGA